MTIFGLKDLEYYRLQLGDVVNFRVENKQGELEDLKYEVHSDFLMNINDFLDAPPDKYYNDEIFTKLGLDSYKFCSKYYGYETSSGIWPRYKDYDFEAATNVVKALYTLIDSINMSKSVGSWGPTINYTKEPIIKHKAVRIIKEDINSKLKKV